LDRPNHTRFFVSKPKNYVNNNLESSPEPACKIASKMKKVNKEKDLKVISKGENVMKSA
jgi:hypothetical protein